MRDDRRIRGAALAVLTVGFVVALTGGVAGLDALALHLAPAGLLLAPLLAGRYVGEERIAALAVVARAELPRAAARLGARLPRAPRATPCGGRLALLAGLGERGPPRALLAA